MNNSDLAVAISRVSKNLDSGCQIVKTRGALRPLILGFTADGRGISIFFDTSDPDQVQDELDMPNILDQFDDTLMHSWMSNLLDHSLVTDEYRSLAQRAMEVASFRFTPVAH